MKLNTAAAILVADLTLAFFSGAQSLPGLEPDVDPRPNGSAERPMSPSLMLKRIATDQKRIWMFPAAVAEGRGWKPTIGVVGATAALVALDPVDSPLFQRVSFQRSPVVHGINHVLSGNTTGLFIAAVPISLYLVSLVRKDSYATQTALLAGEAVVHAEIVTIVMKDVSRRARPAEIGPNGDYSDTWFRTKDRSVGGFGSFPSGHTAAAFSVATVFAERYRNHRWVPWVAYGLAGVIGLSRLNLQAHFPSDIFFGAALGYSVSHFVVLR